MPSLLRAFLRRVALPQGGAGPDYRPDIDGLRAIAVLTVVGFHAKPSSFPGGFVGVDVFFVISGYLISRIILGQLNRGTFTFSGFYGRRIRRIFPALILVLAACFVAGWLGMYPDEYRLLGKHTAAAAAFVSNFGFWLEAGYFDVASELKPLLHLWSLGVEEQFYLAWPLLLFLCFRYRRRLVLPLITGIGAISFTLNVVGIGAYPAATFYLPHTRFWELALGAGLAHLSLFPGASGIAPGRIAALARQFARPAIRHAASAAGLVMVLTAALGVNWHLTRDTAYPGWWALLPTLGTALLIAAGPLAWINRFVLGLSPLVYIGLISYPLYLWHWPLLAFPKVLGPRMPFPVSTLALVAAAFLLSWMTYVWIEAPIRFQKRSMARRWMPFGLAGIAGLAGLAGAWIVAEEGFTDRYPKELRQLVAYRYDTGKEYRISGDCPSGSYLYSASPPRGCIDDPHPERKYLLMLWGDSHSAHLYPALHRLQARVKFRIAQFVIPCTPSLDTVQADAECVIYNHRISEAVVRLKPDTVILAAEWSLKGFTNLSRTIEFLKQMGTSKIVVVGPVPYWTKPLPKLLLETVQAPRYDIPQRRMLGNEYKLPEIDAGLKQVATGAGATYVSALSILCNPEGCLAKLNDDPLELTAIDQAHLTTAGSTYLLSHAEKDLFAAGFPGHAY